MFQFTLRTVLFFVTVVLVLYFSPLRSILLGKVMGLNLELSRYATPGVKLTFLVAIFMGYSALLRGILSAMRRTGDIAVTVLIRLVVVVLVCSITIFLPGLNGTIVGVCAFGGAFASESVFLALRIRGHFKTTKQLFPHLQS